jgi:hypothetical protein
VVGNVEQIAQDIKCRTMLNNWFNYKNQIVDDSKYTSLVTLLLKFDGTKTGGQLRTPYQRKGGNMYSWLIKIKKGLGAFILAGGSNDELMVPATGFDGGVGDYDRYMGQLLWFLAGYDTVACAETDCVGLPIVDSLNRLTGSTFTTTGIVPTAAIQSELHLLENKIAFYSPYRGKSCEAKVMDMRGRVVASKAAEGEGYFEFDQAALKHGVFVLSVKIGASKPQFKRYAFLSH